ncbi:MAG: hypothetical protein HZC24_15385 [Rhodocyclales bacterium]|nr:hypothetical protein [Rhodocyclales bacterium]
MKTALLTLAALAAFEAAAQAPAAPPAAAGRYAKSQDWTAYPLLLPALGGGRGERLAVRLGPRNLHAAALDVFAADGSPEQRHRQVPVGEDGNAAVAPVAPAKGNYTWVVAREEDATHVTVASTVAYFSNPGKAPTALLREPRHELEIVPERLPREHANYRESEKWGFLVRFNGAPLANQVLKLDTDNGSRGRFLTDAEGRAVVLFPRDFRPAAESRGHGHDHGPPRARFVLAAELDAADKHYLTAFNYSYAPDADRDRSLAWGAFFGVLGMAGALPLLRRRKPFKDGGQIDA